MKIFNDVDKIMLSMSLSFCFKEKQIAVKKIWVEVKISQ